MSQGGCHTSRSWGHEGGCGGFEEMRAGRFGHRTENKPSLGKAKAGWSVSDWVLPTDGSVGPGLEDSH